MEINSLWWQKYRPKNLCDLVLNSSIKEILDKFCDKKTIPHLMFIGSPGIGKSSFCKILVNDVLKCDYLQINASDERGIDTIRTKITSFSQTKSFDGNIKVIILEECDALTKDAQDALRNVMEEYSDNVRFVLTGNHKHKIVEAIQSRCQSIDFEFSYKDYYKRCVEILIKEKIKVPTEQIPELKKLTKTYYPDFRKALNEIQKFSSSGELNIGKISVSNEFIEEVYNKVIDDVFECREFVIQNEQTFQSDYHALMKSLLNYIYTLQLGSLIKRDALCVIANYMEKHSCVIDTEINAFNCFMNLNKVLK